MYQDLTAAECPYDCTYVDSCEKKAHWSLTFNLTRNLLPRTAQKQIPQPHVLEISCDLMGTLIRSSEFYAVRDPGFCLAPSSWKKQTQIQGNLRKLFECTRKQTSQLRRYHHCMKLSPERLSYPRFLVEYHGGERSVTAKQKLGNWMTGHWKEHTLKDYKCVTKLLS